MDFYEMISRDSAMVEVKVPLEQLFMSVSSSFLFQMNKLKLELILKE